MAAAMELSRVARGSAFVLGGWDANGGPKLFQISAPERTPGKSATQEVRSRVVVLRSCYWLLLQKETAPPD